MQSMTLVQGRATLRGPLGFACVAALHAALIAFVAAGLQLRIAVPLPPETTVRLIDETSRPPPPPPDEPRLRLEPVKPDVTYPVPLPPDTDTSAITSEDVLLPPLDPMAGQATPEPPTTAPRVDARNPLTQPPYPPAARRLEQQGSVGLELRVREDGRVVGAIVIDSSGYDALDRAAVDEAIARWRLLPAQRGAEAIEGRFRIRVTFRLTDR